MKFREWGARAPIAVIGATGTGKSDLALDLAEQLGGEIINCDAMQLYRGMDIGTAKVPVSERRGIPHHLFDLLEVTQTASVADYQKQASDSVETLLADGITPIICGGSMLYIQSLLDGWAFPETNPEIRQKYESRLTEIGLPALHAELARLDPQAAASILPTDPRRTVRALEVIEVSGKPFAASKPQIGQPRWGTCILGVRCGLEELDSRLERRTRIMFDSGLFEEVQSLIARGLLEGITARRAIGYAQVLDCMEEAANSDSELSDAALEQAQERTFIATRRYVRRQRSWFGRDQRIRWIDTDTSGPSDRQGSESVCAATPLEQARAFLEDAQ